MVSRGKIKISTKSSIRDVKTIFIARIFRAHNFKCWVLNNFASSISSFSFISMIQSRMMSIRPSVCLRLKISVTAKLIRLYSSGNIYTGPAVVLSYFGFKLLYSWNLCLNHLYELITFINTNDAYKTYL